MKHFRTDDPKSNPTLKVDAKRRPRRDHRAVRADAADPIRDAQDVTSARRDGYSARYERLPVLLAGLSLARAMAPTPSASRSSPGSGC